MLTGRTVEMCNGIVRGIMLPKTRMCLDNEREGAKYCAKTQRLSYRSIACDSREPYGLLGSGDKGIRSYGKNDDISELEHSGFATHSHGSQASTRQVDEEA